MSDRIKNISKAKVHRIRLSLYETQRGRCAYCSYPMFDYRQEHILDFIREHNIHPKEIVRNLCLTLDHVDPFGINDSDNLVAAHSYCNTSKGQRDYKVFYDETLQSIENESHAVHKLFNNALKRKQSGRFTLRNPAKIPKRALLGYNPALRKRRKSDKNELQH